ncbi:hypothetical protein AB6809_33610 [Paraburkholderia sp. RCC_158]
MTAGGCKESYCEGYVDQQSGSSSVISAGNNLQINAGSLTNIGGLIAAGNTATIAVAGPVVNEAQTLNAYWHSHWVQETGMFSSDKRHDVWACGSPAECTALYGSAYTSTGGTIDPPQPVGNIAATIQAPNLSMVTRWVSPDEASQWLATQGTAIPSGIGAGGRVYVTTPGAPQHGAQARCRSIWRFLNPRSARLATHNGGRYSNR